MELIQTAEYLEDAPSWEQRRFYPPRYGDPYYRGRGRSHGRGRGRGRSWLNENIPERDVGGRGRMPYCGNGREPYGQVRAATAPTRDERRRDVHLEMPPEPEPSRFSDWSSVGSPPIGTSPPHAPVVQTEQHDSQPTQMNVPPIEATRSERVNVEDSERVPVQ